MKILIIGNRYLPLPAVEGGAIETLVDEYLNYSKNKNNIQFTVYSPYSDNIDYENNKKYINTEFRYINKENKVYILYKILLKIKSKIQRKQLKPSIYCLTIIHDLKKRKELKNYDLVIVENEIKSLPTYRKKIKCKLVEHLHNDYLNIDTPHAKKIVESCDEFWCVSNFIANRIEEISNSNKTRVLYNGIDTKKFTKTISQSDKEKLLRKLNLKKDDYIIIYVGRVISQKGVLELIKGFNISKEKKDNLKLIIVGEKNTENEKARKYIEEIDKESMKNRNSIIFYGKTFGDELAKLYNIADLQVIPTMCNEAFGLIAVEGICANNPLIVSNSGGLIEIVNKESAIIVNRENIVNEIADAILKISTDKKLSNTLVNNANKVKEKFDYKEYNKRFDELIKNITNE